MKEKMNRAAAAAIAKDLVEGGINANGTTKITAEGHGVSLATVRQIRRLLLNKSHGDVLTMCSYVEAIANGWEDESLNLKA